LRDQVELRKQQAAKPQMSAYGEYYLEIQEEEQDDRRVDISPPMRMQELFDPSCENSYNLGFQMASKR